MKKITSEKRQVENPVVKYAKDQYGVIGIKMNTMGRAGYPDRMFVLENGWVVWIEFKKPGEDPTELQRDTINELREKDHAVYVIDSKEAGKEVIDLWVEAIGSGEKPEFERNPLEARRVHAKSRKVAPRARMRRTVP